VTGETLGLGCVSLGGQGRAGVRLVHEALDLGITFFDTADAYGKGTSEQVLGRALHRRRDQARLATKVGYVFRERSPLTESARTVLRPAVSRLRARGDQRTGPPPARAYQSKDFSAAHIEKALDASLRRLRTDHVDLLQLHGPAVLHDDLRSLVQDLHRAGKIRRFGVGLEDLERAGQWVDDVSVSTVQLPFGLLDPESASVIRRAARANTEVIARGVFASGLIRRHPESVNDQTDEKRARLRDVWEMARRTSFDPMQLAAWFATAQEGVSTVLIGTSSKVHLGESAAMLRNSPPADIAAELRRLVSTWQVRC
jgi:1-deoxyxylulose-5-phosphate synthase